MLYSPHPFSDIFAHRKNQNFMQLNACLRRVILPILLSFALSPLLAQTIRGKVFDSHTGEPLIGATVTLEPAHLTTTVQLDGSFVFHRVPTGKYTVVASTVGYQKSKVFEVELSSDNDVREVGIEMISSTIILEQVQVTNSGDRARHLEQRADQ